MLRVRPSPTLEAQMRLALSSRLRVLAALRRMSTLARPAVGEFFSMIWPSKEASVDGIAMPAAWGSNSA